MSSINPSTSTKTDKGKPAPAFRNGGTTISLIVLDVIPPT